MSGGTAPRPSAIHHWPRVPRRLIMTAMDTNPSAGLRTGVLYYGDNLDILRHYVRDESVDLIYLDPPFNSNRNYNVLFREDAGGGSHAQIKPSRTPELGGAAATTTK